MQTVKTSGFLQGVLVKIRGFILNLKVFSSGIPTEQAILRKSKTPRKSPEKWTFLGLAFYNAPSLRTANIPLTIPFGHPKGKRSEKGEGVSHPIGHVETPNTP